MTSAGNLPVTGETEESLIEPLFPRYGLAFRRCRSTEIDCILQACVKLAVQIASDSTGFDYTATDRSVFAILAKWERKSASLKSSSVGRIKSTTGGAAAD